MSDVGIIIVTYNSEGEVGECLDAALSTGAEIVVVDNASTDRTIAAIADRGVRIIANPENRGFAAAVNQGFAVLNCPYVLLLNPDAVIQGGLEALREGCDIPGSAGAGGRLVDSNGKTQVGFMARSLPTATALTLEVLLLNRLWRNNPVNRQYRCLDWDAFARNVVEQPAGAFLMVRRQVWRDLGGLDEAFFPLWFEDVDFCRRIRDRGFSLYYIPEAVAKHTGGHSIPSLTVEMRRVYWYRSLLRYSSKHFHPVAFRVVCLAVLAGSFVRGFAEAAGHRSLTPLAAYGKVASLASRCLLFGF
jgi:hypothetical protein